MGSMRRTDTLNPFARRQNYEKRIILLYRGITIITWLLVLLLSLVYSIDDPKGAKTIQRQNADHSSPFALSPLLVAVYWVVLLLSQLVYVYFLFSNDAELLVTAANLGSHFILNNCLVSGFILLWVHGSFWIAEASLILNFINLKSLYLRHSDMPLSAHWSVIAGPQAWNFVALFTDGAAMVNAADLPARIVANVFIWSLLLYGLYFLVLQQDYVSGLALTYLTLALAVQQWCIRAFSLQTCFAFVILAMLAVPNLFLVATGALGKKADVSGDEEQGERRPLLDDE